MFIALQTQILCIRVANADELGSRSGIFVYCVTNANLLHPRCKRGRVGGQEAEYLFIALQTQIYCIRVANADELGSRSGIFVYCVTNANLLHPRCKRGRVGGQEAEYLFIALQTQTYCIRVANADELGKRGRVGFLLQQIHLPPALFKIGICIGSTLFGGFSVELSYSSIKVNSIG